MKAMLMNKERAAITRKGRGKTVRVVMAVNNPATMDYRVVKSAEALQKAGYDCHVVGVLRNGYEPEEVLNGVTYHRVPLSAGFVDLLTGLYPGRMLRRQAKGASILGSLRQFLKKLVLLLMGVVSFVSATITLLVAHVLVLVGVVCMLVLASCFSFLAFPFVVLYSMGKLIVVWGRHPFPHLAVWNNFSTLVANGLKLLVKYNIGNYVYRMLRIFRPANLMDKVKYLQRLVFVPALYKMMDVRYLQGRYLNAFYDKLVELKGHVYHAHELWLLEACALAARTNSAKLVYDSHELEVHRNLPWSERSKKQRAEYEKEYIHKADVVMTVSRGCADEIKKIYAMDNVEVLRNTPVAGCMCSPRVGLRNTLGLKGEVPLIVYTGAVTFNRGLEIVIHALKELPGFVLATVGPCKDEMREDLVDSAQSTGVDDRFFIHKKVPPDELIEFISSADVAVLPIQNACLSYYYCMPNKLFEAMFAGLPIVASDFPDMKDVILGEEIGVVCDSSDARSIAQAVKDVYERRDGFYTPGKLEALRDKYSFERESKVLIDLYRDLLEQNQQSDNGD